MFEYNTSEIYLSNGIETFRVINLVSHDIRGIIQFFKKRKKNKPKTCMPNYIFSFWPGRLVLHCHKSFS